MRQGGGGIKAPSTVSQGAPIVVDVQSDEVTEVVVVDGNNKTTAKVNADGKVVIPANPAWTPGTVIYISTTKDPITTIVVEVSEP